MNNGPGLATGAERLQNAINTFAPRVNRTPDPVEFSPDEGWVVVSFLLPVALGVVRRQLQNAEFPGLEPQDVSIQPQRK